MQDPQPSSATNSLFLSLFISVLLVTLAFPVRNLALSLDTLFDQSYYHSQHILHGEITSSEVAYSCMMSPHQVNMHSLVVMAGSWKGRCAFSAVAAAAAVSDSVQEEVYGCLTTAKISASHPLADKKMAGWILLCVPLQHSYSTARRFQLGTPAVAD